MSSITTKVTRIDVDIYNKLKELNPNINIAIRNLLSQEPIDYERIRKIIYKEITTAMSFVR